MYQRQQEKILIESKSLCFTTAGVSNDDNIDNDNLHDVSLVAGPSSPFSTSNLSIESCHSSTSTSDFSNQTPLYLSANTPRKERLESKLKTANQKIRELEKTVLNLSQQLTDTESVDHLLKISKLHLQPSLFTVVKSQINLINKKKQGFRYDNEIKQLALNIYFLGPRVYKLLINVLSLPSITTLKRATQKFELTPGINDFLFNIISLKISHFNDDAKECVLCADEMALKSNLFYMVHKDEIVGFNHANDKKTYNPAKYALVFMIRGINFNWKQPIAYYLVSSSCTAYDLQDIIFSIIQKLLSIGLNIKCFITDMGPNFVSLSKKLNVSPFRPKFVVGENEIIYIFDPPHLLKSTRNMLFKHNFKYKDDLIDKKYLVSFYEKDSKNNLRLAPKLTHSHIFPGPFEKMRVFLASQVFSQTVVAGMKTFQAKQLLDFSSKATIEFLDNMDKLFDIFNSSKRPATKIFNKPFKQTLEQENHLKLMQIFFTDLKVINKFNNIDVTNQMKFINGWLVSIAGLQLLWKDLKSTKLHVNQQEDYVLYTNRINQDCLENLFCTFRQQQGNNTNPTPYQFTCAFKKIFLLNYFKHSEKANCIDDLAEILTNISADNQNSVNIMFSDKPPFQFKNPTSLSIGTVDYRELDIPEQNAFIYVCGYLMKKCLTKHSCDLCIEYAKTQKNLDPSFLFSYFKAYENKEKSTFGSLLMPHNDFYNYIYELETIFINSFPKLSVELSVGQKLKQSMVNVVYEHPCSQFDKNYILSFFIRFRIYSSIKFLNKNLVSEKKLKNRKLAILQHL